MSDHSLLTSLMIGLTLIHISALVAGMVVLFTVKRSAFDVPGFRLRSPSSPHVVRSAAGRLGARRRSPSYAGLWAVGNVARDLYVLCRTDSADETSFDRTQEESNLKQHAGDVRGGRRA